MDKIIHGLHFVHRMLNVYDDQKRITKVIFRFPAVLTNLNVEKPIGADLIRIYLLFTLIFIFDIGLSNWMVDEVLPTAGNDEGLKVDTVNCRYNDSLALIKLYNSTNESGGWIVAWDFNSSIDTYYGITLNQNGCVSQIILENNGLNGEIPTGIGDFSELEILDLSHNQLNGRIRSEIEFLEDLTFLDLSYNGLSDAIASEIEELPRVQHIDLSHNEFVGTISTRIDEITQLQFLDVSNNRIEDSIGSKINRLQNLTYLDFSNNSFFGEIPSEIGQLSNLSLLNLSNNELSGKIPSEIGDLISLDSLILSINPRLTGGIPDEIGQLTNLRYLNLAACGLGGTIPDELGDLSSLEELYLSNDSLFGSIPLSMGVLESLEHLDLSQNQISGEIPESFGNLESIKIISLFQNRLSGSIPISLGEIRTLQRLYLQNNQLEGFIPSSLGENPSLLWLGLFNNNLRGCFPASFDKFCQLGTQATLDTTAFGINDSLSGVIAVGNPMLPWEGDISFWCDGVGQIGAVCNDSLEIIGDTLSINNCICSGRSNMELSTYNPLLSPNGDGINEVFSFEGIVDLSNYPDHHLIIVNRYGDLVYESEDYKNDWDGSYEGGLLPSGTYYFLLLENKTDFRLSEGFISIISR